MNGGHSEKPASPARREEAVAWHVRLASDDATEADFQAFEGWVSDPANRAAFDALDAVLADVSDHSEQFAQALSATVTPIGAAGKRRARPLWIAAAGIATVAAAVAIFVMMPRAEPVEWTTYSATQEAMNQAVLSDGTRISLNRGAAIRVSLGAKGRHVEMANAEAAFDVAHDPARPFVIDAGDDQITVVGTEFNVLATARRTVVTVRRGIVTVASRQGGAGSAPARLLAGDQLIHEGGVVSIRRQVGADAAFAWQGGHLVYSNATLADIVDDLNRYLPTHIRIDGADAARLTFSGVIAIDDQTRVIERLQALLPVSASRENAGVVLRLKK